MGTMMSPHYSLEETSTTCKMNKPVPLLTTHKGVVEITIQAWSSVARMSGSKV